jgi:chloramphenicol-sensitive protein RarD
MKMEDTGRAAALKGTLAAFTAYAMWGLFPLYWKELSRVESGQILAHRIFWAGIFCLVLALAKGRIPDLVNILRNRKKFLIIALSSIVVSSNWGIYIWAVNSGRIIESALGYYINPLLSVALGVAFFREKADAWTKASVSVATAGIIGAGIVYGSIPWLSILIAATFALYGALKKTLGLDPLLGLTIETLCAAPLALVYLIFRHLAGAGAFIDQGAYTSLLLVMAGVITAIPLLFFALAANTISLQKMGFIQYLSPSGQLFLAVVVFGERPSKALLVALSGVIIAVSMYVCTRKWKIGR